MIKKVFRKVVNKLFPCKFGRCKDKPFGCNCGTFIGLSAGTIGTAALGAGGLAALFGGFGGGKKKGASAEFFDPFPQQRSQLMDLLFQGSQQGVPGLEEFGQQRFQELLPQIQETFQARRGLGAGSTPEVLGLGRAAQGVATNVTGLQAQAQQNYARTLAGLLGQPTTAVTPQGPSGFENLLNFGAPVAGSFLQSQAYGPLLKALLGGEAQALQPDIFGSEGQQGVRLSGGRPLQSVT